jgi:hypothetical protein
MSTDERIDWYLKRTTGPKSFLRGVALTGFSTWRDSPSGWDRTTGGFSQRMGHRFARVTLSNSIQLGMGFLINDDPRYYRAPEKGFGGRVLNAALSSVTVRNSSGNRMPAYSRFAGVAVSNAVAKTWLPPGRDTWTDVATCTGWQIGGQAGLNVLREFWPDIKRMFKK